MFDFFVSIIYLHIITHSAMKSYFMNNEYSYGEFILDNLLANPLYGFAGELLIKVNCRCNFH